MERAQPSTLLAGTALAGVSLLNVSFLRFGPESCQTGNDPIADITVGRLVGDFVI